jgi:TIR domain.
MRISISYAHRDSEIATQFYKHLSENKFEVFWDKDLPIGGKVETIQDTIFECDVLLVILSENSIESSYVQGEMLRSLGYSKVRGKPRVIPYKVYGAEISMPLAIQDIKWFMGSGDIVRDSEKLVEELNKLRGEIIAEAKESHEKVETLHTSLATYIEEVFEKLEKNEKRNRILSYSFYGISFIALILAIVFALAKASNISTELNITQSIQLATANVLILALMIAVARLAFILGKAFMVDCIRNSDRIHAISFGKFFIQAYGDKATKTEIREVFGEWNIDKGSSFHTQEAKDFDPNVLNAFDVIKSAITKK